jgi:hypothetical protein
MLKVNYGLKTIQKLGLTVSDPRFSLTAMFFILASSWRFDTSFKIQFDFASVIKLGIDSFGFSLMT